jgi:glyoxylase-like metal-dependent hydrolase (beta-lactamase superfamily II)
VFIASFPAGPWETNCYVLAGGPARECVIVDPGFGAAAGVADVVAEHRLKPVAVLVTHGHLDHMYAVTPICSSYDATCWVHPHDRALLTDPLAGMGPDPDFLLARLTGGTARFVEPDDVRELSDGASVEVAGMRFGAVHAPGHTAGSVMFSLPMGRSGPGEGAAPYTQSFDGAGELDAVVLSGDVLFAGSIGRTDLPGGDAAAMRTTLRTKVLPLADSTAILPGHGPQTTMARERVQNPYLQESA